MFDKNRISKEKEKKITIILGIILVIIIFFRACTMPQRTSDNRYHHEKCYKNTIAEILRMPFFYVLEYPKIIMGICNDDSGDRGSAKTPVKEKQYIKF